MLLRSLIAVSATLISTSVIAGDISPTDVSFGEYGGISGSLTGVAGDPVAGKKVSTYGLELNYFFCSANFLA